LLANEDKKVADVSKVNVEVITLNSDASTPAPSLKLSDLAPSTEKPVEPSTGGGDNKESSGGGLGVLGWILIVLVIIVLVGGAVYYCMFFNKQEGPVYIQTEDEIAQPEKERAESDLDVETADQTGEDSVIDSQL